MIGKGSREMCTLHHNKVYCLPSLTYVVRFCHYVHNSIVFMIAILTSGQSNLTKCASRGPIPRLGVIPGGLNLYHCIYRVGVPISVP